MSKSRLEVVQGMQQRLLDKIKELEAIESLMYQVGASGMDDVNEAVAEARAPIQNAIGICKKRYASNIEFLKNNEV